MKDYLKEDRLILTHHAENPSGQYGAVVPPIYMNSLHVFDTIEKYQSFDSSDKNAFIYGRDKNPSQSIVEEKISALERGEMGLVFGSGMGALSTALLTVCKHGDHVICINNVYGPMKQFIDTFCNPSMNISVTYVKGVSTQEFEDAIRPETKLIVLESPSTFVFSLSNLREVAQLAKKHGIITMIDNTFCTPLFQKPLELGIDISMHTLSKYFGGHSDVIGGVLVSKNKELMEKIRKQLRAWLGAVLGPMEAWLVLRGMRTLEVRINEHQKTATAVAEFLEKQSKVSKVYYPNLKSHPQYELMKSQQSGNTGLLSFELDADIETTMKFANKLKYFQKGCSWGGFESLAIMPLTGLDDESFNLIGAKRNLIRIHCGLEGADTLIEDLDSAFKQI